MWDLRPKDEWVHAFIHKLDEIPRSWYVSAELCREITTWDELTILFVHKFIFAEVNNSLQIIQNIVLKFVPVTYPVDPHAHFHMQSMMECYNISFEPEDDDELRNINILETEGS